MVEHGLVVEHGLGKRKLWRIVAERDRNRRRRRHALTMTNVAGRHHLTFA